MDGHGAGFWGTKRSSPASSEKRALGDGCAEALGPESPPGESCGCRHRNPDGGEGRPGGAAKQGRPLGWDKHAGGRAEARRELQATGTLKLETGRTRRRRLMGPLLRRNRVEALSEDFQKTSAGEPEALGPSAQQQAGARAEERFARESLCRQRG